MRSTQHAGKDVRRLAIRWNGEVVGHMEGLSGDMWWIYGRWLPADLPAVDRLLALLPEMDADRDDGEIPYNDQWVELQSLDGSWNWMLLISQPHQGVIDLRMALTPPTADELRRQAETT